MGHQIIEQPDGKLCVFSTVTDSIIIENATGQELLDYYAAEAAITARLQAGEIIKNVRNHEPEKTYHRFTMTYKQAVAMHVNYPEG